MSQLTVREAAERVGVTRQTLFKYIRQRKISATIGHDKQKRVDVSELIRVFGELQPTTVTTGHTSDSRTLSPKTPATPTTTALQLELERLKSQLHFKEAELELAKERISELKGREIDAKHREREATEERMRLLGVIETQNRLLAAPISQPPTKTARTPRPAPAKRKTTPTATKAPAKKATATVRKSTKPVVKAKATPAKAAAKTKTAATRAKAMTKATPKKKVLAR